MNYPIRLALILWGEDEDDVQLIQGIVRLEGGEPIFRAGAGTRMPLTPEWVERIKPVGDDIRSVVGQEAEAVLSLTIGDRDGPDEDYIRTGLRVFAPPPASP